MFQQQIEVLPWRPGGGSKISRRHGRSAEVRNAVQRFIKGVHNAGTFKNIHCATGSLNGLFFAQNIGISGRHQNHLIKSHDFEGTCGDLEATTAFAQTAHLAGIDTYVLALPDSNPQIATGPFTNAARDLASAGGTTFFDATTRNAAQDTAKGLEAFTRAAVDLATCTYENAPASGTKLSYVNATGVRVVLESNAACTGGRGWTTTTNGRAKLCDTTCSDYRDVVRTRGLVAAMGGSGLDEVPIVIRTNCND